MAEAPLLELPDTLMHADAPEVVRTLGNAGQAGQASDATWVIDASRLRRFDSSALAVLLECRRIAGARGGRIEVHGAPARLEQLARLYRLEELLPMRSVDQAEPA